MGEGHSARMKIEYGVVLAGGKSKRMGRDKATVEVGGLKMLERVTGVVAELGLKVVVVGRERPVEWKGQAEFLIDDAAAGEAFGGPVVGIITALERLREGAVVLGCDMPLITAGLVGELIRAHEEGILAEGAVAGASHARRLVTMAVTVDEAGRERGEPMLAVYGVGILPVLREMVRAGRRSLQGLMGREGVVGWRVPAVREWEVLNVNDADGLRRAEELVRGRERGAFGQGGGR